MDDTFDFKNLSDALFWLEGTLKRDLPPNPRFILQIGPRWPGDKIETWKCNFPSLPKAFQAAIKWNGETRIIYQQVSLAKREEFRIFLLNLNSKSLEVTIDLDYVSSADSPALTYAVTFEPDCPEA